MSYKNKFFNVQPIKEDEATETGQEQEQMISAMVEIPLATLVRHCDIRDVSRYLYGKDQEHLISIDADLFMKIAEAPRKPSPQASKLVLPIGIILGVILAFALFVPFYYGLSFFMFCYVAVLVFISGVMLGWVFGVRYRERLKAFFSMMEEMVHDIKLTMLEE